MTDYVFLDTETTGLDFDDEIVEIAIVDPNGSALVNRRIRPTVSITPEAAAVHGISDEAVADAPQWPDIAGEVQAALEGKTVVIFNAEFDLRLLQQTIEAFTEGFDVDQYDAVMEWFLRLDARCAMYRAADVYGATNPYGTISLVDAVSAAGIEFQGKPHSAAGDAATTAALWRAMQE